MWLIKLDPNAGNGLAPPIAAPTIHMQSPGQAPAAMYAFRTYWNVSIFYALCI